jgi:hypothetical protein
MGPYRVQQTSYQDALGKGSLDASICLSQPFASYDYSKFDEDNSDLEELVASANDP